MSVIGAATHVNGVVHTLRPLLGERLLVADDAGFAAARRVWNAAVTRQPSHPTS